MPTREGFIEDPRRRGKWFDPLKPLTLSGGGREGFSAQGSTPTPAISIPHPAPVLEHPGGNAPPITPEPSSPTSRASAESPQPPASFPVVPGADPMMPRVEGDDPAPPSLAEAYAREYRQVSTKPARHRGSRFRPMVENALHSMGQMANNVVASSLRSGRGVDAYGMAAIAGAGAGGAGGAAMNPHVVAERKRLVRMEELGEIIQQQLRIEKAASDQQQQQEELRLRREKLVQDAEISREQMLQRSKPKPFVLAGKRIDYRWDDEGKAWEPFEVEVNGEVLVDRTKVANEAGLTPNQQRVSEDKAKQRELTERIANNNLRFRSSSDAANRRQRSEQFAQRMKLGYAEYERKKAADAERARQRAEQMRQAGQRTAISVARARLQAKDKGYEFDDYLDILDGAGVEVTDK